jgi:leucyl aminopeptidase
MKISFTAATLPINGTAILPVAAGGKLGELGQKLNKKTGGALDRAMQAADFTGKSESSLTLLAPAKTRLERVILLGIGDPKELTAKQAQILGSSAAAAALAAKVADATFYADHFKTSALSTAQLAAELAFGLRLRAFRFDKYRTKKRGDDGKLLKSATLACDDVPAAKRAYATLDALAQGVELARRLVLEPGNVIHPVSLAQECLSLKEWGLEVKILDEKAMAKLGMGALLGVAQGSAIPPRLGILEWRGDKQSKSIPTALIGKGVTFDTGGISLKPGPGMEEMIFDMAGAAAVIGTMAALAKSKAPVNVVGLVGLVENMPDGNAQRPGDIVTSMSGQTIEVHNTDAEGRLVLADVVWYAQETYKPHTLIDLATLTGAIIIALGQEYAGLFSNDETLAQNLQNAAEATGEKLWRMPLGEAYDRMIDADTADMKNIAGSRDAGSTIGAQFIQRFVKKGTAWAHLDIAGTAWTKKPLPLTPKGATAFGVRLLYKYLVP